MRDLRLVDVECRIEWETEKAYKITIDDENSIWIPKKLNDYEFLVDEGEKGYAIITMPEWFAAEKGLI